MRRLTGSTTPGERYTDAVGVLTSWDGGVLRLTRRNGEIVQIAESAMVAAKVVPGKPGAPRRRRGPAAGAPELTRVAARGWPAVETEQLGGWELRAAGGFTSRGNSVLVLDDPGLPLDDALERVTAWYATRELPALIQVSTGAEGTQEQLADALDARGWTRHRAALMQIAPLAPLPDAAAGAAGDDADRVTLSRTMGAEWLTLYNRGGGEPTPAATRVLHGGPSVWFATVPGPEGPAAIGRCVVDGRWAGFAAVEVAPAHRRGGLATAVMAALARQALAEGASAAYLQVEPDNEGALALYERLGFRTHHAYHYRRRPGN